jgi:hypothetical protein
VLCPSLDLSSSSLAPAPLLPNDGLVSQVSSPPSPSQCLEAVSGELWQCSLGCGQRYERSSGRSIRRHMTACFRSHWPGGDKLSEAEVQSLMSTEQASGHLVTGLRRWKLRQTARPSMELVAAERWSCVYGCSQVYRVSSSRSIQQHLLRCKQRPHGQPGGDGDDSKAAAVSGSSAPVHAEDERGSAAEDEADRPVSRRRIPAQLDGVENDVQFSPADDGSDALQDENSSDDFSSPRMSQPSHPMSTRAWPDTALHVLLRRQQQEAEHLSPALHGDRRAARGDGGGRPASRLRTRTAAALLLPAIARTQTSCGLDSVTVRLPTGEETGPQTASARMQGATVDRCTAATDAAQLERSGMVRRQDWYETLTGPVQRSVFPSFLISVNYLSPPPLLPTVSLSSKLSRFESVCNESCTKRH